MKYSAALALTFLLCPVSLLADNPSVSYIFPAGGQRGTTTKFTVGGHFLYEAAAFEMSGVGLQAAAQIKRTKTVWFEGPVIPLPASQKKENYPKDYAGQVSIAADAALGVRYWHVSNSQGITPGMKFVVGELPEIVEEELDGKPVPVPIKVPVTINGRIFPREDIDIWTFNARAGQSYTCEVVAARIGSGLDSRIQVLDPTGRRIAENVDTFGSDSFVRFTATSDGAYSVRIQDINFGGLQHFVYRLTVSDGPFVESVYPIGGRRGQSVALNLRGANLPEKPTTVTLSDSKRKLQLQRVQIGDRWTNRFALEASDSLELLESEPNDEIKTATSFSGPAVLNGLILRPGDVDIWSCDLKKGQQFSFEVHAGRLGSSLDSVLTITDSEGKQLATNDDSGGVTDSQINFKAPRDGTFLLRIYDRLSTRGGPRFAYRIHVIPPTKATPDFRITLPSDVLNIARNSELKLKVNIERIGGFAEEVQLQLEGLPDDISVTGTTIAKKKSNTQIVLKAAEKATIRVGQLRLIGKSTVGEQEILRTAVLPDEHGQRGRDSMRFAITMPTPFKFSSPFETKYASRGSVYSRHYKLERGGFEGPIEIELADRQARHLQGVTGPKIVVPPGKSEFDYQITLPPWMEIGRTSRTCLMAVGVVEDKDGRKHKVSYSSQAQDDQFIVLVDPCRISVKPLLETVAAHLGKQRDIPIRVGRGTGVTSKIIVELIVPRHIVGVRAEPLTIAAGKTEGILRLQFSGGQMGPFNMPLTLRARTMGIKVSQLTAEAELTIIAPN